MDTVTQITLGAAVGEVVLGKKMANKGPLWGAIMGIVPDLDVLITLFVSEVEALTLHRGITHSLLFCVIAGPLLGRGLHWLYQKEGAGWKSWSWMVFWALITHIGIDLCTTYGTQILQPFSNQLFSLNAVFIIDPFYTVPLMIGVITALFMQRESASRQWANYLGIGFSTLYLLAGLGIKTQINAVFEQNFNNQEIHPEQYMTTPTPFNILLWNGYAVDNDTLYAGLYSIFDDNTAISFKKIPQHSNFLSAYHGQLPVDRLLWFSRGYFSAEKKSDTLLVHDLRFGRSDLWITSKPAPFVWNYRLQFNKDSTTVTGFKRYEPTFDQRSALFNQLINRVLGEK